MILLINVLVVASVLQSVMRSSVLFPRRCSWLVLSSSGSLSIVICYTVCRIVCLCVYARMCLCVHVFVTFGACTCVRMYMRINSNMNWEYYIACLPCLCKYPLTLERKIFMEYSNTCSTKYRNASWYILVGDISCSEYLAVLAYIFLLNLYIVFSTMDGAEPSWAELNDDCIWIRCWRYCYWCCCCCFCCCMAAAVIGAFSESKYWVACHGH